MRSPCKSERASKHDAAPFGVCEAIEKTEEEADKPRRAVSLRLDTVLDAMEAVTRDSQTYYNTLTGELYYHFDHLVCGDSDQPEPDFEAEGWTSLPDSYDIEDLRWIRRFAREQPNPVGSLLLEAAFERHPYRRFKDRATNLGVPNDWFDYREERMRVVAQDWFKDNGLIPAEEAAGDEKPKN